jgi:hypothetical protein
MSHADRRDVVEPSPVVEGLGLGRRVTRRQALGRMSALASAGAAAWVAPQILMAKPAAGASLSAPPTGGSGPTGGGTTTSSGSTTPIEPVTLASTPSTGSTSVGSGDTGTGTGVGTPAASSDISTLANTGFDLERDAAIGAGLIAGGWALQRWASRRPKLAVDGADAVTPPVAGSSGAPD